MSHKEYASKANKEYSVKSLYTAIGYCIAVHDLELICRNNSYNTATFKNRKGAPFYLKRNSKKEWVLSDANGSNIDTFTKHERKSIVGIYSNFNYNYIL